MPAITDDVATRAAEIYADLDEVVKALRSDRDLTSEGLSRRLSKAYVQARDSMIELRREFETERAATAKKLNRDVFGTGMDFGADVMSVRDAADRASQLTDPQEAARLLQMAEDNDDQVLARAIAQHAHRNAVGVLGQEWAPVLQGYLEDRPEVASRLEQMHQAAGDRLDAGVANDPEAHFYLAKPTELERVTDSRIEAYAAEAEPVRAETQQDRNRQITETIRRAEGGYTWLDQHKSQGMA